MLIPIILSGGSGTRLWPLSRELYPKQFHSLITSNTLFQDTILRLPEDSSCPLVICNEDHRFIVAEQLREINSENQGIILEPIGKNTAPAIALASLNFINRGHDPILLVLSADHLIENKNEFNNALKIAEKIAQTEKLVALGIKPTNPETGYGYIEVENSKNNNYHPIVSFTEKPSLEVAKEFINRGDFYWNSGIFMFKASQYLSELEKFEPEIFRACKKAFNNATIDSDFIRPNYDEFIKCPNKSVDYAVMEKTQNAVVVPFNSNWSDVGSWNKLWTSKPKDIDNNATYGDVHLSAVKNSYIYSSSRLVAVNDLSDLIVVDTQDALLVSSKKNSDKIKNTVSFIKASGRSESYNHRKVFRPWGYYDSIDHGNGFQVKRINVNPGAKLSLQKHHKRSEHWVVIKGIAKITCGTKEFILLENESTYIPKGTLHRLENQQTTHLQIIEIQTGEYLGEDDILRLEDEYHRE